jgi:rubrerythrin
MLPLSDGMLHQLCKSALALEVDATGHAERVLRLLRGNRWRARAETAMDPALVGSARPTLEQLQKLLTDAERAGVDAGMDVVGSRLAAAVTAAVAWQGAARDCIARLKSSGGAGAAFDSAAAAAVDLVARAEALHARVDADLASLQECSKLYCLCRQPYDDQRPMLGCDHCSDWFHYECVGLGPSSSPGGKDEGEYTCSPPSDFRCPICCMRSSVKYAHFHRLPPTSLEALKAAALAMSVPEQAAAVAAVQPQQLQQQQAAAAAANGAAAMAAQQQAATAAAMAAMAYHPAMAWQFAAMAGMRPMGIAGMPPAMLEALQQAAALGPAALAAQQQHMAAAMFGLAAPQAAAAAAPAFASMAEPATVAASAPAPIPEPLKAEGEGTTAANADREDGDDPEALLVCID